MAWIDSSEVEAILRRDLADDQWIDDLIDHAQGLAETEIGEQAAPSNRLRSQFAAIVARMWQDGESARINPAGLAMEVTGPFTIQDGSPGTAGLGLTNREKAALRRAVGKKSIGVLQTTRGDLETPPVIDDHTVFPAETDPWNLP